MSTDMSGIFQPSLFSKTTLISVPVPEENRYRILSEVLSWTELAEVANKHRSKKVNIMLGRSLDLRAHLGAYIAQSMNGWTDRETEEMLRYHAGVRILCGLQESNGSIDRTSIEKFRNHIGSKGAHELHKIIVKCAAGAGFTGSDLCSSDTTVQEAPIQYPTEVGHMKKINEKLLAFGSQLNKKAKAALDRLGEEAKKIVTEIRLFTRGKTDQAIAKKKKLSLRLHSTVKKSVELVKSNILNLQNGLASKKSMQIELYEKMLEQIIHWLRTGKHPVDKIVSLWSTDSRAITRNKAAKAVEFGRRWIVTRLSGGYVFGAPCEKLGGDSDVKIAGEVLANFVQNVGTLPTTFVYDRGGDGALNHQILEAMGIQNNCVFRNANEKMSVSPAVFEMARRERALSEANIANLKHERYGLNKPRARSMESCILKGFTAMMGFNTNHLLVDVLASRSMCAEIT